MALSVKAIDGLELAFVNVKDGQQLSGHHQFAEHLRQVEKLELAAAPGHHSIGGYQIAQPTCVNGCDALEIQKDVVLALFQQRVDRARQRHAAATKSETDSYVAIPV